MPVLEMILPSGPRPHPASPQRGGTEEVHRTGCTLQALEREQLYLNRANVTAHSKIICVASALPINKTETLSATIS